MKHLKLYEEFYHRTMGFRYSKPSLRYSVISYCSGDKISEKDINDLLSEIDVTHENLYMNEEEATGHEPEETKIVKDEEGEDKEVENPNAGIVPDYVIGFDLLVYNDREVDKIINDFTRAMYLDHGIKIVDVAIREVGKPESSFIKNESFKFRKTEEPKKDKLYLLLNFAGGDADTEHPEYHEFRGIKFSEYQNHLDEINKVIGDYKILKKILDNHGENPKYEDVKSEYGDEIAKLYDNTPNDPQADYQFKCYLSSMELIGYDEDGNKHEAYI